MGKIRFTERVVFKDMHGNVQFVFEVGDIIEFTAKTSTYWVCCPGGIYFDEAEEIADKDKK